MMQKIKTLLSLTLLTHVSKAEVDLKKGNFYKTWVDVEIPTSNYIFQLRRTYDSRSLHQGIFGYGWCSDFEKSLELKTNKSVVLHDCKLRTDIHYESIGANQFGSRKNPKETLLKIGETYLRKTPHSLQKFNQQGQLVYLSNHSGFHIKLHYHQTGELKKIDVNSEATLTIKIDRRRKLVQTISAPKNPQLAYTYQDGNLTAVRTAASELTQYEYDDVHNLTQIIEPDSKLSQLSYNKEKDWVTKIRDHKGCLESFHWLRIKSVARGSYQATTKKTCHGRIVHQRKFEYVSSTEGGR